jgi:hypothetical protein
MFHPLTCRSQLLAALCIMAILPSLHAQEKGLPFWKGETGPPTADWMLRSNPEKAALYRTAEGDIVLDNGLLSRRFRLSPNLACIGFRNRVTGEELLRAVGPEARLTLDGKVSDAGGLHGQRERAYLREDWLNKLTDRVEDLHYVSYAVAPLVNPITWKTRAWIPDQKPATGITITFTLTNADSTVQVRVAYALYDHLPLLCKWVTVENSGIQPIKVDQVVNEVLAMPEEESAVVGSAEKMKKPQGIYVESNFAFNNAMQYDLSDQTTHWKTDSSYTSQVNYNYTTPCVLEVFPEHGPGITLQSGERMESVRTHELLLDSYDRQRRGLIKQRMYAAIAPWTRANPIFMHLVSRHDLEVKEAIDQCAEAGYEAVILSFGSHCDMEDSSAINLARWKLLADYAHSRNILIGAYSLLSSRRISDADDVIDPKTGKPGGAFFGNAPCLGSRWGQEWLFKIRHFLSSTGFDMFENDGPYPGDVCASTVHPGHVGLGDSQWKQMDAMKSLYHWCAENGIYVNAPDWYFLDGTNKIALGYREVNFSLPRDQQVVLNRQNIYDGTWDKSPSMGWGFVPLTKYQGGDSSAVLEPLKDHLADYEKLMMQYYSAGVQACYRGPRLYDAPETKALVVKVVAWYKKYRLILNAPVIHLRRPDGRDWDGILHADPNGKDKGMLLLYNPTPKAITRRIDFPAYYAGLKDKAIVAEGDARPLSLPIGKDGKVRLNVTIPAQGSKWYTVR